MNQPNSRHNWRYARTLAFALAGWLPLAANADTLSDNLGNATYDIDSVQGTRWLAASFGTGATSYTLDSITLLLANSTPGAAELDLYSDFGGLQPDTQLGILTPPASISSTLANTTFTASGLTLNANTTYWAVLKANSGVFDWGFTADNTGSGAGFQGNTAETPDAGASWFAFSGFPFQLQVIGTPIGASAVPEPGVTALLATSGLTGIGLLFRRRTPRRKAAA